MVEILFTQQIKNKNRKKSFKDLVLCITKKNNFYLLLTASIAVKQVVVLRLNLQKQIILPSEWQAEHPFAGRNTRQTEKGNYI